MNEPLETGTNIANTQDPGTAQNIPQRSQMEGHRRAGVSSPQEAPPATGNQEYGIRPALMGGLTETGSYWIQHDSLDYMNSLRLELESIHDRKMMYGYDALTDGISLFLMKKIVDADGVPVEEIYQWLANGLGWAKIIRLVQSGYIVLSGNYIVPTSSGVYMSKNSDALLHLPSEGFDDNI